MNIKEWMIIHEGYRKLPYKDSEGIVTIGIGFNLEVGLDDEEIDMIFRHRILKAEKGAFIAVGRDIWVSLNNARQQVLTSMAYQMGSKGLSKFQRMISALGARDYDTAASEMQDSRWAKQTPNRAKDHARAMKEGVL